MKDINKDGIFETNRHVNPLEPNYLWRDNNNEMTKVNSTYGHIEGNHPKKLHPTEVHKKNDLMYNTRDIEGTTSNSAFNRAHFMDVRLFFIVEKVIIQELHEHC